MTKLTARQKDKLIEAAQTAITFTVEGKNDFPFDMLRYDLCWPASESDSSLISFSITQPGRERTIKLKGLTGPTPRRWASFGWTVVA
jgi:hypothetical protein